MSDRFRIGDVVRRTFGEHKGDVVGIVVNIDETLTWPIEVIGLEGQFLLYDDHELVVDGTQPVEE